MPHTIGMLSSAPASLPLPSPTPATPASKLLQPPSSKCIAVDVETIPDDDATVLTADTSDTDSLDSLLGLDQGRASDEIFSDLNTIDVPHPPLVPSADISDDASVNSIGHDSVSSFQDDIPGDDHAQIDTGAWASCTGRLDLLHGYREFGPHFPCPVRLMPATDGSDTIPKGVGFLHVPAHNQKGYLAVRTYYHPSLRTTVIDERDFAHAAGFSYKHDISSDRLWKYHDAGNFTYHATHRLKQTNDVVVHGIVRGGKSFTHALIPPCTDALIDQEKAQDPTFADSCRLATIQNVHAYHELELSSLRA